MRRCDFRRGGTFFACLNSFGEETVAAFRQEILDQMVTEHDIEPDLISGPA